MAAEKIPKEYSPVAYEKIVGSLLRRIETLEQAQTVKRLSSLTSDAAPLLRVGELGFVRNDTQSLDLVLRADDGRFYRIGALVTNSTSVVGSGGTIDHGSLSGLADDDHTQYVLRSILTTKGDLFVRNATVVTRQAIGADNKPLVAEAAQTTGFRYGGKILVDEVEIDADLNHDGSNVGFYGVAPAARPSAYTQTYATVTRTHSNPTAVTLTDNSGGTANTTVQALTNPADLPLTADALRDDLVANLVPELRNNIADLTAQINALVADLANAKQVLNQVIDDQQAVGLFQ